MQAYFSAIEVKKSLAEPVDFFHYKGNEIWHCSSVGMASAFPQLNCGRAPGRPKPARLTSRDECTCDRSSGRVHEER